MAKKKVIGCIATGAVVAITISAKIMRSKAKKSTYKVEIINPVHSRKMGFYEKYIKRIIDVACAAGAIIVFSPLYLGVAFLVKIKLGSPVLFTQERPGLVGPDGKETVFKMYKFRSMTDEKDENGELLPDDVRLTKFGKWLRNTSLDELPEAFNILNGTMSVIGPRPQLVRDMVFMSDEQRMRHTVKPGLSGLAQVNGRNAIPWEDKIDWDLKYIEKVSFFEDLKIIFATVKKAFIKQEGITQSDRATAEDLGDYLLRIGKIDRQEYESKQEEAKKILSNKVVNIEKNNLTDFGYTVAMCVYAGDRADWFKKAVDSVLNQTLPPSEIVLVVDGPVANELNDIIKIYENNTLFNVIRLEKNQGHGIARKIGLEASTHELIAIMDSDDISVSDRFEKQIRAFKETEDADIIGGMIAEFVDSPENIVGKRIVPTTDGKIKDYMKRRCPMNLVTVMFRKSSIEAVGGFVDWYCEEDYYLWLRMARANMKFLNIEDVLVNVRVGSDMYQRRGGIRYFKSEAKLQKYMLKNKIIGIPRYIINVSERFVVQILMPTKLRGYVFKKFARNR